MFWFRRVVWSVVVLMSGGIGEAVIAQSPTNLRDSRPSPTVTSVKNGEQLVKELNLTPVQVQQLKALRQKFHGQKQGHRQLLNAAKQELDTLIASNAPAPKIALQRDRIKTLQKQLTSLKFDNMVALKEILTPEQWAKLQRIKQQRAKNVGGNR